MTKDYGRKRTTLKEVQCQFPFKVVLLRCAADCLVPCMSEKCSHMLLRASPCRTLLLYTKIYSALLLHPLTRPSLGQIRRSVSSMTQDPSVEYNKQWFDTWQQGLQPGQVGTSTQQACLAPA